MKRKHRTTGAPEQLLDEYLVLAVQGGDRAAAERLAARWYPRLLRTARRLLGELALAEDAAQECWVAIARGLPGLSKPERFPAWAFRILHRRCHDQLRQRYRYRERTAPLSEDDQPSPSRAEMHFALDAAFAALSDDHRAVAVLFYGEGLSVREISDALATPEGTIKSRLFHARRQLKTLIEGDNDE